MLVRSIAALALAVSIAACGGTAPTIQTESPGGNPAASGGGSTSGTGGTPAGLIDLSNVDACAIVDESTIAAVTGEPGPYDAVPRDSGKTCFWAVPKPGVPQYVEIQVARRNTIADFNLNVNGAACPGASVSGLGVEARGGVCVGAQTKVWLIALDRGVSVFVQVNEPKSPLTPENLADLVKAVFTSLG